ncbi:hypothetical protein NS64R_22075 [Enterobacter hormaechei subsp. xiangfangensis]|nr:hypothetical protein NS64R_22075 [Enterobacter hormaechei subsp. xiangfangensis]
MPIAARAQRSLAPPAIHSRTSARRAGVLGLQVLEPLGIGHAHAAELAAPQVVGRLTEAMPSAQVLDRHAGLGFAQEADDLLFGKALLYVQSPRGRELDSKRRCYSN